MRTGAVGRPWSRRCVELVVGREMVGGRALVRQIYGVEFLSQMSRTGTTTSAGWMEPAACQSLIDVVQVAVVMEQALSVAVR